MVLCANERRGFDDGFAKPKWEVKPTQMWKNNKYE
jgi:hypothetical protein